MADGKRKYKSDRKDYKISVKLSEKDMELLNREVEKTHTTMSCYIRELIRTGGSVDMQFPADRAKLIRVVSGIANNINQAVKLGNTQGKLYFADIMELQSDLDEVKRLFWEVLEKWQITKILNIKETKGQKSGDSSGNSFELYSKSG